VGVNQTEGAEAGCILGMARCLPHERLALP
jgi:hypothetical protein